MSRMEKWDWGSLCWRLYVLFCLLVISVNALIALLTLIILPCGTAFGWMNFWGVGRNGNEFSLLWALRRSSRKCWGTKNWQKKEHVSYCTDSKASFWNLFILKVSEGYMLLGNSLSLIFQAIKVCIFPVPALHHKGHTVQGCNLQAWKYSQTSPWAIWSDYEVAPVLSIRLVQMASRHLFQPNYLMVLYATAGPAGRTLRFRQRVIISCVCNRAFKNDELLTLLS